MIEVMRAFYTAYFMLRKRPNLKVAVFCHPLEKNVSTGKAEIFILYLVSKKNIRFATTMEIKSCIHGIFLSFLFCLFFTLFDLHEIYEFF